MLRALCVFVLLLGMAGYCGEAPKEVKELANKEIPGIVKKVFAGDKVGFGFSESDRLDQMTVSEPYTILGLEREDFEECQKNPDINCMSKYMDIADSLKTWDVIVKINGIGKFTVQFIQENGKWVVLGYGGNPYSEDFNKLFKLYGQKNVLLFGTNSPFQFFYHIKKYGNKNLSLLVHKKVSALSKEASDEEIAKSLGIDDMSVTAKKAIEKNKEYISHNKRGQ